MELEKETAESDLERQRQRKREIRGWRDKNMVLNLLRHHHHDKYRYVLVTVYS